MPILVRIEDFNGPISKRYLLKFADFFLVDKNNLLINPEESI